MSKLRIRLLQALTLTAVTIHAQVVVPRGTTRLESGSMRLLHGSTAAYPEAARRSGIEGTISIEATLDAKGHVVDAHVVAGPLELRAAALKSVLDDHFVPDPNARRPVQLSVIFSLQKSAPASTGLRPEFFDPPKPVVSTACSMLPTDLCTSARERLAPQIGSTLTPEKVAEFQKELADLDDHLIVNPRKIATGFVLDVWLRYETASEVPAGIVGGVIGGAPPTLIAPPPPPPPVREAPVRPPRISAAADVQQTKLVRHVNPVYPPLAKQARIQGTVVFSAVIGKDGTVQNVQTISGHPLLIPAALDAVREWKYQPTALNGEPVEVITRINVTFTLQ